MSSTITSSARRGLRGVPAALAALLACLFAIAWAPAPAHALGQLTCAGSSGQTFTPGLTNTPTPTLIEYQDVLGPCVSATDPTLTSGTGSGTRSLTYSCTSLLGGGSATRTFHWNNGQSSTFTYTHTRNVVAGQLVILQTGTITAGEFAGSSAVGTLVLAGDLTACSGSGATTFSGPLTLNVML
jgi:hypothetical protein